MHGCGIRGETAGKLTFVKFSALGVQIVTAVQGAIEVELQQKVAHWLHRMVEVPIDLYPQYTLASSTIHLATKLRGETSLPRRRRSTPVQATITPLSTHRRGGGQYICKRCVHAFAYCK